jgi:hypothetical protein
MRTFEYDRVAILNYLRQAVKRMREIASARPDAIASDMLAMADEIAADVAALEPELIEAGYLSKRTNGTLRS